VLEKMAAPILGDDVCSAAPCSILLHDALHTTHHVQGRVWRSIWVVVVHGASSIQQPFEHLGACTESTQYVKEVCAAATAQALTHKRMCSAAQFAVAEHIMISQV
jgi:hypothetical protein